MNKKIYIVILIIVMLLSSSMTVFAATNENQAIISEEEVLILSGFQYGLPVADIYTKSIVDTLRASGIPVGNIFVEYLDLNRKNSDSNRLFMQEKLLELSINHSIELIIAIDQVAADFIVHEGKDLFEGVPLIVSYDEEPVWEGPPRDLIIAAASNDAEGTVRYAFELFPNTQNVVFIEGKGDEKARFIERLITAIEATDQRITIERTNNLPYSEMLDRIAVLPPDTIAFYGSYFQDVTNETFVPAAVANTVGRTANVPVFAFIDMHIKQGLVGGSVVINEKLGQQVAQVALDYFSGKLLLTDEPIRVYPDFYPLFDWQQLKRWDADPAILPDETMFLNYTPTLWESHRELILVTSLFIAALIFLVVLLFITNKKQKIILVRLQASENDLQNNKEYLNNLIRYANAPILTWAPDYKITEFNRAFEKLTGRTREEVFGQHLEILFPDDSRLESMNHIYKTVAGEFWEAVDIPITHTSGKVHSVLWNSANIKNPEGKLVATIAQGQDITARIQAEEQLRFQAHIIENSPVIAAYHDKDLNTVWVNRAYQKATGLSMEEIRGRKCYQVWNLSNPCQGCPVITAIETGENAAYELTPDNQDNWPETQGYWLSEAAPVRDEQGVVIGAIEFAVDITERRLAGKSLKTYADRLMNLHRIDQAILQAIDSPEKITQEAVKHIRDLLDCQQVSVGMFDFDKKEVRIFAASGDADSVVQVGQVLPEEFYGDMDILQENNLEIIEDNLKMETVSTILRTIQAEGVRSSINAPIRSSKGLIGVLSIGLETARTITSEEQEIASEVASQIAIAIEQARLLQETKRHADELEEKIHQRTSQLEAKTRELETFSYSVAHDLKAPLRGIDGYSRLLLEDYNDRLDEEGRQFLNTIRQSAERMNQLIEDLLAYSRLERRTVQKHPHNIRMLAQTSAAGFEVEIQRRSGTVKMNVPDIVVNVDSEGLTIALRNLLDNALKYIPLAQQPVIEIGAEKGEKTVVLWIRDNGIGFDMKYHDRIFGIFNRLHRSEEYPGTGIGLAMVRKALERMGGRVWAESQPEKGAAFYIEIPLNNNEGIRSNNERS